jgi:pimeloyl-ACP methyl ester carboxylesterase/heme-degrading monooxygenase HmoA
VAACAHIWRTSPRRQRKTSDTVFFNVWRTQSSEAQLKLLSTMRTEVSAFAAKPGFLGMDLWAGQEGDTRVLVEAHWASREHFNAAVANNPEAHAGRSRMQEFGAPEPGLFALHSQVAPPDPTERLIQEAKERWMRLGFNTNMLQVNGVYLHVAEAGKGKPVVLLHGYPQSGEIWRLIASQLANKRRVIIPDLRGMGLSSTPSNGCDLLTAAEDIHHLVQTLKADQIHVVGHDWGGAVAAVYAMSYRNEVSRLVFVESALAGAGFEGVWTFAQPNPAMTFIPLLLSDSLTESLIRGREDPFLYHLWDVFTANKDRAKFDTWHPYLAAMKRPGILRSSASYYRSVYNVADRIRALVGEGRLTIPLLSIAGRASLGDAQLGLVKEFTSNVSGQTVIEDAGHFIAEEEPEALLEQLEAFLA